MKKSVCKLFALGVAGAICITVCPVYGNALNSSEETPLAGITVTLDHYCDVVAEEIREAASAAEGHEIEIAQLEEELVDPMAAIGVTTDTTTANATENTAVEQQAAATPAPTKAPSQQTKIKLNLKYDKLGLAKVKGYVNVRKKPGEDGKIIGKMTNHNVCNIVSEKNGWAKIESGKVKGYVKADYLIEGEKAEKLAEKVASLKATVKTQTLNVRYLPSTDARIYDQFSEDEEYAVEQENLTADYMKKYIAKHCSKKDLENIDTALMYEDIKNWVMLSVDDEKVFVSKDFITMKYTLGRATTIDQIEKEQEKQAQQSRLGIVQYAMQFLGNRYVWGGTSLTNGTDCSGFTQGIYRHFGVYLPRTSAAQAAALPSVKSSDVRVGDLFFYGSGHVSHVALYIGNGRIIHASNHRDGIKISSAYYRKPLKIGRPS